MKPKLIKDVDDELWKRFRIFCIKNEVNVSDVFNGLLREFLKNKR